MTEVNPMNIIEYIDTLITSSMKAGDKDMLSIYRLAKSELIKQQKDKGSLDHIVVFKSMKKRLLEEIDGLEKAGRDVSIQKKHLAWIESELPQPVSEESIRLSVLDYILDHEDTNIGKIMAHLKLIYTGKLLDMQLASKIVKETIGNK